MLTIRRTRERIVEEITVTDDHAHDHPIHQPGDVIEMLPELPARLPAKRAHRGIAEQIRRYARNDRELREGFKAFARAMAIVRSAA